MDTPPSTGERGVLHDEEPFDITWQRHQALLTTDTPEESVTHAKTKVNESSEKRHGGDSNIRYI